MSCSRRRFLRGLAATTVAGAGVSLLDPTESQAATAPASKYAVLADVRRCVGCRTCEEACRRQNELDEPEHGEDNHDLSRHSYTAVGEVSQGVEGDEVYSKWQCMHCLRPTCVTICPAGALTKTDLGPVEYNVKRCIGCRYCVIGCLFGVPRFDWEERKIARCVFCPDRLEKGIEPACVESCPERLFTFGERADILAKAEEARQQGALVYGVEEAGGTSWIYLSDIPFEQRNFPEVDHSAYPEHSKVITGSQLATVFGGALALGLYSASLMKKRVEDVEEEGGEP